MGNVTIKAALAIIPILLGTMFFAGVIYDWYWFHEFGIDKDVFPQSIQQYMLTGVLAYIVSATKLLPGVFKAAILVSALTGAFSIYLYVFGKGIKDTTPVQWFVQKLGDTGLSNILIFVLFPIILVSFYLFTLFILAILVLSAGSAGTNAAQSKVESFDSGVDRVSVVFRADVDMSFDEDVYLIKCTGERCAFYVGGKAFVIERDLIASISSDVQRK